MGLCLGIATRGGWPGRCKAQKSKPEFSCPPIHGLRGRVCAKLTLKGRCPPPLSTEVSSVTVSTARRFGFSSLIRQLLAGLGSPISFVSSPRPHACRPVRFSPSSYSQVLARLTFSPLPLVFVLRQTCIAYVGKGLYLQFFSKTQSITIHRSLDRVCFSVCSDLLVALYLSASARTSLSSFIYTLTLFLYPFVAGSINQTSRIPTDTPIFDVERSLQPPHSHVVTAKPVSVNHCLSRRTDTFTLNHARR